MFNFFRRKNKRPSEDEAFKVDDNLSINDSDTCDNFVDATNGGWETPDSVEVGGSNDYVKYVLENAKKLTERDSIEIGESFIYVLDKIPSNIKNPHEIIFNLMLQASNYGLRVDCAMDESVEFTRIS